MSIPFEKSFASHEKSKYWSSKNDLKPEQVKISDTKNKYYFECDKCNHEFLTTVNPIVKQGTWCPYCANLKLCDKNDCSLCYDKSFASHEKSKYWSSKNELTPRKVFKASEKQILFNCDKCNHEIVKQPALISRKQSTWCYYCSNQELCELQSCISCYEKSFASSERAKYWSSKNQTIPRKVFKNSSNRKYIFYCPDCNHEVSKKITDIENNDIWCYYCSSNKRQLCEDENCKFCFNNSFASHERAKCWSPKNIISPRQINNNSVEKFLFNCEKCNHEFRKQLIEFKYKDTWCPYCNSYKLCEDEKCKNCFEKSFASHEKAKYWSSKNDISPRQITRGSGKKYLFVCENNHEFMKRIGHITDICESWCPFCYNKTEQKVFDYFKDFFDIKRRVRFEWAKNINTDYFYEYDMLINNTIIEIDGRQHFEDLNYHYTTAEKVRETDIHKMKLAINKGYNIIRIFQEDIWNDKINWKNLIDITIQICNLKIFNPKVYYIAKDISIYDNHKI